MSERTGSPVPHSPTSPFPHSPTPSFPYSPIPLFPHSPIPTLPHSHTPIRTDHHLTDAIVRIAAARSDRATLVALSGIDGSGKTTLARLLETDLTARGLRVALIHLDPWHHPASVRLADREPGEHFYHRAFRWSELFQRVIDPLVSTRHLDTVEQVIDPFPERLRSQRYEFRDIDVVLLEGIFLLRRELRPRYDLAVWLDCDFSVALRRALLRNQEGLSPRRIILDYETIYFPAQRHHLAVDDPVGSADRVLQQNGELVDAIPPLPGNPRRPPDITVRSGPAFRPPQS